MVTASLSQRDWCLPKCILNTWRRTTHYKSFGDLRQGRLTAAQMQCGLPVAVRHIQVSIIRCLNKLEYLCSLGLISLDREVQDPISVIFSVLESKNVIAMLVDRLECRQVTFLDCCFE